MPVPEFIDRANNPQNYPYITNPPDKKGRTSHSTHRMATEVEDQGTPNETWYVFPTIVPNSDGSLHVFEDAREALAYNKTIGNFKSFGKDKEAALKYGAGGYKTKAMSDYSALINESQKKRKKK